MRAAEVIAELDRHAGLFGTTARDEAGPDSDLDIVVQIDPEARLDVYDYVGLVQFLQDLFPQPVDVANLDRLKPHVRPSVERDAVYAF